MSRRVSPASVSTGSATWKHSSADCVGAAGASVVAALSAAKSLYFAKGWTAPELSRDKAAPAKKPDSTSSRLFMMRYDASRLNAYLGNMHAGII
ncbi:hypothetical protein RRF57_011733 [Xylaria bambusicola]|uniref:Uncharacterized protein n=1 Tax=Xylaria bambusicola TaxID=326684 RepID=A0AAN7ZA76_9PEZI